MSNVTVFLLQDRLNRLTKRAVDARLVHAALGAGVGGAGAALAQALAGKDISLLPTLLGAGAGGGLGYFGKDISGMLRSAKDTATSIGEAPDAIAGVTRDTVNGAVDSVTGIVKDREEQVKQVTEAITQAAGGALDTVKDRAGSTIDAIAPAASVAATGAAGNVAGRVVRHGANMHYDEALKRIEAEITENARHAAQQIAEQKDKLTAYAEKAKQPMEDLIAARKAYSAATTSAARRRAKRKVEIETTAYNLIRQSKPAPISDLQKQLSAVEDGLAKKKLRTDIWAERAKSGILPGLFTAAGVAANSNALGRILPREVVDPLRDVVDRTVWAGGGATAGTGTVALLNKLAPKLLGGKGKAVGTAVGGLLGGSFSGSGVEGISNTLKYLYGGK